MPSAICHGKSDLPSVPNLLCHPAHFANGYVPVPFVCFLPDEPVSPEVFSELLLASLSEDKLLALTLNAMRRRKNHTVCLAGSELFINMSDSQPLVKIDLVLSQIIPVEQKSCSYFMTTESSERHLLVVPKMARNDTFQAQVGNSLRIQFWLFSTNACTKDFDRLLLTLNARGAIRLGLADQFDLDVGNIIGTGAFGIVMSAAPRSEQKPSVAIKLLTEKVRQKDVLHEVKMLLAVNGHANIIGFRGLVYTTSFEAEEFAEGLSQQTFSCEKQYHPLVRYALLFELIDAGDLRDHVKELPYCMDDRRAITLLRGIFKALAFLHAKSIIHRDVKCENILLRTPNEAVLSDFGLAIYMPKEARSICHRVGSIGYAAPEQCCEQPSYDYKADIFAAGVCLYFMLSAKLPFPGKDKRRVIEQTQICQPDFELPQFQPRREDLLEFMVLCMAKEDFQRPSASEGLQLLEMLLPETVDDVSVPSTNPTVKKMAPLQRFARGALSVSRTLRKKAADVWNDMSCIRGSDVKPFENLVPTNVPAVPSTYAAAGSVDEAKANTPKPGSLRQEKEKRSDVKPSVPSPVVPAVNPSVQDNSEVRRKKIIEESKTGSHKAMEVFLNQREEVQLNSGSNIHGSSLDASNDLLRWLIPKQLPGEIS
jgi:serine/threonine protein kinase